MAGKHSHGRRTFLAGLGAASALAAIHFESEPAEAKSLSDNKWDMSWLEGLKGKHKQVFDVASVSTALHAVMNYLDAFEEIYGMRHPQVNAVVGIAGKGFAYNATDRLWAAYKRLSMFELGPDGIVSSPRSML